MALRDVAYVDASSLLRLSKALKDAAGNNSHSPDRANARSIRKAVKNTNQYIAAMIAEDAKRRASTRRQSAKVAEDPAAFHTAGTAEKVSAFLSSAPQHPAGDPKSFALGSEFGAKHDIPRFVNVKVSRRLRENVKPGAKTRRAYTRTFDYSESRVMKGWNQFQPWRGSGTIAASGAEMNTLTGPSAAGNFAGAAGHARTADDLPPGYWLYPTIREDTPRIREIYTNEAADILNTEIGQALKTHYW
jgi:hypothetical protein